MFGYVTACKERLSDEGKKIYQSYYCGLCHAIGKRGSQAARLGLSNDITFLALVLSSLGDEVKSGDKGCILKGFKAYPCVLGDEATDYAADMGIILTYLKFLDDWHDDKSPAALFKAALFFRAARRAGKRHGETYRKIRSYLNELNLLERKKSESIDETAHCFAKILETLFTPDFEEAKKNKAALGWLGYNIGRWIYIIDAYNDIEKDIKKKTYNPFVAGNQGMSGEEIKNKIRERIDEGLIFTLENACGAYDLIDIKRNKEVIENILFTALKLKQKAIITGDKNESL